MQNTDIISALAAADEQCTTLSCDLEILRHADRQLLQTVRTDLNALPPFPTAANLLRRQMKIQGLDAIQALARQWNHQIDDHLSTADQTATLKALHDLNLPAGIDWTRVLHDYNMWVGMKSSISPGPRPLKQEKANARAFENRLEQMMTDSDMFDPHHPYDGVTHFARCRTRRNLANPSPIASPKLYSGNSPPLFVEPGT